MQTLNSCTRSQLIELIGLLMEKVAEVSDEIDNSGGGACCGQGRADTAFEKHSIARACYREYRGWDQPDVPVTVHRGPIDLRNS
jgi:hypothetical protein